MARGAERTGDRVSGVATSGAIVPDLGGGLFVVSGLARFRPSTSPQRLEPECIGPAGAEDVAEGERIMFFSCRANREDEFRKRGAKGNHEKNAEGKRDKVF